MTTTLTRMHTAINEYAASIDTCAYDKRAYVLSLLAEQMCEGLAGLAEDLTNENGDDVHACAEGLIDNIKAMFSDSADKREDRRANQRVPVPYSTLNVTTQGLTSPLARV